MTQYNTGYPVPSPAMPDVWDNNETIDSFVNSPEISVTTRTGIVRDTMFGMQKKADEQRIAASVALAEQMDSQESAFNAAQTDKEDRFQGFLNSSGYVFLGNYENGPFQFSARNQYIRYNNQYYRLNAATDVGFTTTGTDATSFANDIAHFVLMDGDTLRQNLISVSGAGLSGCDFDEFYEKGTVGRFITNSFFCVQNLQDYYDKYGNWDDALFAAQCNVAIKDYSPILYLPAKVAVFYKPILAGGALGDAIHAAHPELNFKNETTGEYAKTWPLILIGTRARWADGVTQDGVGSQIVFSGCASQRDYTWQNSAAIYGGPTNPYDRKTQTAVAQNKWFDTLYLEDLDVRCLNQDGTRLGKVHGIVSLSGKCLLKNVLAYQFYGAGIYLDWNFEPIVEGCAAIQCGRMADALPGTGTTDDFITLGRTTKEYQTYGPVHIGYSAAGSDNSNFVSFRDLHVEDNYYAAADIVVSGNSSPVRIYDVHFECDPVGIGSLGEKWSIVAGRYGVRYFGQDTEPDFNPASTPYTQRSGFVSLINVAGNSANYAGYYAGKGTSGCVSDNCVFPNIGNVEVNGGNADAYFYAVNANPSIVKFLGGNSNPIPLKLSNCKAKSIVMSYASGYMLSNTEVTEGINIDNELSNPKGGWHHSNVIAASINGVINYGSGDISLTSTSVASNLVCYLGDISITRYAYYNSLLGAS